MREVFVLGLFLSVGGSVFAQNQGTNCFIGAGTDTGNRIPPGTTNAAIVAGSTNTNSASFGFLGGGASNVISANSVNSFLGAGQGNNIGVNSTNTVLIGGQSNIAVSNSYGAFVGGGMFNRAGSNMATIVGGYSNFAVGAYTVVGGGFQNVASNVYAASYGGFGNRALGISATIGGGFQNTANANYAWVGGGYQNLASAELASISGGRNNQIQTNSTGAVVGGGYQNLASGVGVSIAGGYSNRVSGTFGSVGGGHNHAVSGFGATVGGGGTNLATNNYATVAGGSKNTAGGSHAAVGGGNRNVASGEAATVPGGRNCDAVHTGSFVWSGEPSIITASWNPYTFTVRARGGARFYTSTNASTFASLPANATAWSTLSDRDAKTDFRAINKKEILEKLSDLPVNSWHYKHDRHRKYIGPTAQDFHASFGLGEDEKTISTLDSDGVMYAAIQGLVEELKERDQVAAWRDLQNAVALAARDNEIENLKKEIRSLKTRMDSLSPPSVK